MYNDGALGSTDTQTGILLSRSQGSFEGCIFSNESESEVVSSCKPADDSISPGPFNLFKELRYSQEVLRLGGELFNTSFEPISPKSAPSFISSDRREELQCQMAQLAFCKNNVEMMGFDAPSPATQIQKLECGARGVKIVMKQANDENMKETDLLGSPTGRTLQSEVGDCSSNPPAMHYSRLQQSSNLGVDVTSLCSPFWDESLPIALYPRRDDFIKVVVKPVANSSGETGSSSRTSTNGNNNDKFKAEGRKQTQLKKHNQTNVLGPQLGKHTFPTLSVSYKNEKPKNLMQESVSSYIPGTFSIELPTISQTLTNHSRLGIKYRVLKRRVSEEEEKETFISCRMKKFRHVELKNPRAQACPSRPISIPSVPVIPDINALKTNLLTMDRRNKNSLRKKVKLELSKK